MEQNTYIFKVFRMIRVTISAPFSYSLGLLMSTFYTFFGSGPDFGGELRPRSEQSRKRDKTNQKRKPKRIAFSKNSMLFVICVLVDFWKPSGKDFFAFWWRKCAKWELLGDTFPVMSQQRW